MHVQNRTKTVHVKAETSERRVKFDPVEAMSRLNAKLVMILVAFRSEKGDSPTSVVFASCVVNERF